MKKKIISLIAVSCLLFQMAIPSFASNNSSSDKMVIVSAQNFLSENDTTKDKGFWIVPENSRLGKSDYKVFRDKAAKITKGTAHPLNSIPVQNVSAIQIDTDLCGLAIEPFSGDQIQVTYYGENQKDFNFQSKQSGSTLNLTIKGTKTTERYVNPYPEKRYNTYVLQVPSKNMKELSVTEGAGATLFSEVGIPQTKGSSTYGFLSFEDDKLTSSYTVDVTQGWIDMKAKEITGTLNLSAAQGWIEVDADTISGTSNFSAEQGWIDVLVGKLTGKTTATTAQGWIDLAADSITSDVNLESTQGWVNAYVKQDPQNLRVTCPSSSATSDKSFPSNWRKDGNNSYYIGSGSPVLTLKGSFVSVGVGKNQIDFDGDGWGDWQDNSDLQKLEDIQDKIDKLTDKLSEKYTEESYDKISDAIDALEKELAKLGK